jgi:imidazolonepropionase
MTESGADSAPGLQVTQWTLIRGARQLLTLHGANGPRRRSCLNDLSIIADGAVLMRGGIIHEIGTTRRIENMDAARSAREIDATGKIVMPAFVDPDFALAAPSSPAESDIRRMSRKRLESRAASLACDAVRYGVTTLGANTLAAPDLQNTLRALRIYRAMNLKPARLRAVVSPGWKAALSECALAVSRNQLASMYEIEMSSLTIDQARSLARVAASTGCDIRFRVNGTGINAIAALAIETGCTSVIASSVDGSMAEYPWIHVVPGSTFMAQNCSSMRDFVDCGGALALASGYQGCAATSMNPQYLLFSACRDAGLTIEEAITATTHNAAYALGLGRETGSLAPGKSADICIMDVGDYHELAGRPGHHDVWMVLCAGRVVFRRAAPLLRYS